ncbi:MAG: hypothetical protein ACHQNT_11245, partial [Bacteroidia bacterium]
MTKYIIRRILIFLPTLIAITLLAFIISVNAPGDPVERMMSSSQTGEQNVNSLNSIEQHQYWRKKLGLDLPLFYFSIHSLSTPDTLYRIFDKYEKEALERLINQYGNWKAISEYYNSVLHSYHQFSPVNDTVFNTDVVKAIRYDLNLLKYKSNDQSIENTLETFDAVNNIPQLQNSLNEIKTNYTTVKSNTSRWKNLIPVISFHKNNQYHRWLFGDEIYSKGILRGDFGISYVTKQPVSQVIGEKIFWSLFLTLISV